MDDNPTLKKRLALLDVFCIASGAMISSGLFVLPAIACAKAGPAMIVSYLFASILILPSLLSKAELATAMPRAGGTYFYVERSLGPTMGLFSGLANWFSQALKSAFAVVGMAVFIEITLSNLFDWSLAPWHLKAIAALCCLAFTILNIVSVKQTSRFEILFVALLLVILTLFIVLGLKGIDLQRYKPAEPASFFAVLATSGLVFISFGGLTKVASIAEEVKHPARNLPRGMILSWAVVTFFYLAVIIVTVGLLDTSQITASLAPISTAAAEFLGTTGFILLGVAAIAAFVTTANGGILAASRSPMAMSRDRLLPAVLARVNKRFSTPHISIILTCVFMIAAIVFLDIESLVKTASTLMIILFILANLSVIIMRESKIQSYRPGFKSPLYPYLHIIAIILYALLIIDMGLIPLSITAAFFLLSAAWYQLYVARHVSRASAVMHIVERVTDKQLQTVTLENELRDILLERDEITADRFDHLISQCEILDIKGRKTAEKVFRKASAILAQKLDTDEFVLFEKFLHREAEGSTVIQPGMAIPHIIVDGTNKFDILLIRAIDGIDFPHAPDPVKTIFVLIGSKDQRNYHLRALMAIAQIAQEKDFEKRWLTARDTQSMRNLILLSKRKRDPKADLK